MCGLLLGFLRDRLHGKTGKEVIGKMKAQIARHGIPDVIVTDNGPPLTVENSEILLKNTSSSIGHHLLVTPSQMARLRMLSKL